METVIRVAIVYVFILFGLRVMGKREFSQLSPAELVTLLLIPELVAQGLVREDFSLINGLVALSTLFSLVFLTSTLSFLSPSFSKALSGTPTVLVHDGELIVEHLNRERIPPSEIFGEMHKSGIESLSEIKWAILETDGKISIIPLDEQKRGGRPDEKQAV